MDNSAQTNITAYHLDSESNPQRQKPSPQKVSKKPITIVITIVFTILVIGSGIFLLSRLDMSENVDSQDLRAQAMPTIRSTTTSSAPSSSPTASPTFTLSASPITTPQPVSSSSGLFADLIPASSHYVGTHRINFENTNHPSDIIQEEIGPDYQAFTVSITLPPVDSGEFYQVWQQNDQGKLLKFGTLTYNIGKFSYYKKSSFSQDEVFTFDDLYHTVIISKETIDDDQIETTVFINKFERPKTTQ